MSASLDRDLTEYARLTAADTGERDIHAGIRAMRDEPQEVAAEVGCTAEDVIAWCERALAAEVRS